MKRLSKILTISSLFLFFIDGVYWKLLYCNTVMPGDKYLYYVFFFFYKEQIDNCNTSLFFFFFFFCWLAVFLWYCSLNLPFCIVPVSYWCGTLWEDHLIDIVFVSTGLTFPFSRTFLLGLKFRYKGVYLALILWCLTFQIANCFLERPQYEFLFELLKIIIPLWEMLRKKVVP